MDTSNAFDTHGSTVPFRRSARAHDNDTPQRQRLFPLALLSVAVMTGCGGGSNGNGGNNDGASNDGGSGNETERAVGGSFQEDFFDFIDERGDFASRAVPNGADRVDVINEDPLLDAETLAVLSNPAIDNPASLPGRAANDAWAGAVAPDAGAPDGDPSNNGHGGGPYWDGWTFLFPAGVNGGLPLTAAADNYGESRQPDDGFFHPLEDEIRGGAIAADAFADNDCPAGVERGTAEVLGTTFPICEIATDIVTNVTLTNDHVYVLAQTVNVGDGGAAGGPSGTRNAVLTLEPGTQLYAAANTETSLVVTRGSRIEALGTAEQPVIMASGDYDGTNLTGSPSDLAHRGRWGGLVLSGAGVHNACNDADEPAELESNAVPAGTRRFFGCDDNGDSSGTLRYVVIAEAGGRIGDAEAAAGLRIEAAGSGTTIEFVQILGSDGDGIAWLGGAADASKLVINGPLYNGLDFDGGVRNLVQTAIVRMDALKGLHGIEGGNSDTDNDAVPRSTPDLLNITLLGHGGTDATRAGLWRSGFGGELWRSVMTDDTVAGGTYDEGCLDINDQVDQNMALRDVVVNCANGVQGTDADNRDEGDRVLD